MQDSDARSVVSLAELGGRCRKVMLGVWSLWQSWEEGAGKRCSECGLSGRVGRKVPESDAQDGLTDLEA